MARHNFWRHVLILTFITFILICFVNSKQIDNENDEINLKYSIEDAYLNGLLKLKQAESENSIINQSENIYIENSNQEKSDKTVEKTKKQNTKKNVSSTIESKQIVKHIPIEKIIDMQQPLTKAEVQTSMPIIMNAYSENYLKYMSSKKLDFVKQSIKRGSPYLNEMKKIFAEYGIPEDLVYLPVIESGFKNFAYSSAKAVGMWQFIPDTAKWIGMNVNSWIDERRDPIVACKYAAKYLKFLYDVFEDWYLVLAAYNHGGVNIKKEMKQIKSTEYYDLVRTKATPAETRGYVPSLIAVLYMLKHYNDYNIDMPKNDFVQDYDYVHVPFMAQSNLIAKYSDITLAEFNALNPALNQGFTPDKKYKYNVRLPKTKTAVLAKNMEKLKSSSYSNYISYYVKSGDSLSGIAYKYGISLNVIMKINNISNANKIKINQRIYIPNTNIAVTKETKKTEVTQNNTTPKTTTSTFTHIVKSGENLSSIAYRYGVTMKSIMASNKISNANNIKIGQKLLITKTVTSKNETQVVKTQPTKKEPTYFSYYVKRGDSLSNIAYKYGIPLSTLMKINNISNANKIKVNQKLYIPNKA